MAVIWTMSHHPLAKLVFLLIRNDLVLFGLFSSSIWWHIIRLATKLLPDQLETVARGKQQVDKLFDNNSKIVGRRKKEGKKQKKRVV